jgi:transcriptional regulator with XRE-family HTH domain
MKKLNIIWRQVVKLRQQQRLTQEDLAVKLQHAGWHNATRSTVSKIEGGTIHIADFDVLIVAAALRVQHVHLYPEINWQCSMDDTIHEHIPDELHDFVPEPEPNQKEHLCKPPTNPNL